MKIKEIIVGIIFIACSLAIYGFFPADNIFQKIFALIVFFIILPLVFVRLILKKRWSFFGINLSDWRVGIKYGGYSLLFLFAVFIVVSKYSELLSDYTVPSFVVGNFTNFIFYEFGITLFFVCIYEFYFRGFVMQLFREKTGYWSILIQSIIFFVLVFGIGEASKSSYLPYIVFAPIAGIITYKTNSIFYSGAVQFILILAIDIAAIKTIG